MPADKSPVKKEYKEPTTRTDDIAALPCQSHAVPKDADGKFVATFNWEMKKVEGELAADYSNAQLFYDSETGNFLPALPLPLTGNAPASPSSALSAAKKSKPSR